MKERWQRKTLRRSLSVRWPDWISVDIGFCLAVTANKYAFADILPVVCWHFLISWAFNNQKSTKSTQRITATGHMWACSSGFLQIGPKCKTQGRERVKKKLAANKTEKTGRRRFINKGNTKMQNLSSLHWLNVQGSGTGETIQGDQKGRKDTKTGNKHDTRGILQRKTGNVWTKTKNHDNISILAAAITVWTVQTDVNVT